MRRLLAPSFWPGRQPETGCILLVAKNDHQLNPSLLVSDLLEPQSGDFVAQGPGALSFGSHYLRRALLAVRDRGLGGFLTVHTHPFAKDKVGFSFYDDSNDPELMSNLYDLQPGGVFGSVVAGTSSLKGRVWKPGGGHFPLTEMVSVGERVRVMPLNGFASERCAPPAAVFDRALALTGGGALSQLAKWRVGVIGDSGTGSLLIEVLMRAGVGEIVIFEFDHADRTNLNRVLHMRMSDVQARRLKSERTAEVIANSGLPTRVTIVDGGDIRNEWVADQLRGCDVLCGCVDRDWPRLILCEAAYQYLIPLIDLGSEIGVRDSEIQSLDSRVSYVSPGRACLLCAGVIKRERVVLEGHSDQELGRIIDMGYNEDIRLDVPAVMELNMRAAAQAGLLLRHLVQPFLATPLPHSIRESLTNFSTRGVNFAVDPACLVCGLPERLGSGSRYPLTTRKRVD
jgi:hypothetical protein